ncbi:hypothetical protein CWM47_30170 [Spirosoma pollinicola]|uniref:Uncharacterized protein n=1 Tax=Spirosoma pollinicola TaxID=2057025 RepID=A0A2K8Z769_9BACT|nr:hypothetical protein CWM47_30170 [Spirosoma pollinicola]
MVWKLHKLMAVIVFRCALLSTFSQEAFYQLDEQVDKLNRLKRIVRYVRQYYSLHPNFAKHTYGSLENYLERHISEQDWILLNQLHLVEPLRVPLHHKPVLDIA